MSVMRDLAAREGLRSSERFVAYKIADCDRSIPQRFEQQVAFWPDAPAVRLATGDISSARLNANANRAARCLLSTAFEGTGRDLSLQNNAQPVALLLNQGYESIVWTLAILKAGCCYAPLDQRLPVATLRSMMEHLGPVAIVADAAHLELAQQLSRGNRPVIQTTTDLTTLPAENLNHPPSPDAIAYIFYTSGSTGAPKGVADCHRNILHNILRYTNTLKFAPGDTLSLVQNPSFSGTVSTLFGGLLNGATIAPFDLQDDGLPALSEWLRQTRATVFHAVPSIFRQLSDRVERFPNVRLVRLEGDRVTARDVEHFRANFQNHCTLVNGLGATECGLVRQFFINKQTALDETGPLPIGYPVPDMTVRVVDERGTELPAEATGEIVVESPYLAIGYWRNPALTAEKFISIANTLRHYRTGDLGRMSQDGCLFHLGRVDYRPRIAGEFVDVSEIEAQLLRVAGVRQCAVSDFEDQAGERRLAAYVVADPNVTASHLRQALAEQRAPAQPPCAFVFLAALPLTSDLKIDRQRLPRPSRQRPSLPNGFVAPQTPLEWRLACIWSEVLEIDEIGVTDSFFDLGGDSLQATRVVGRLTPQQQRIIKIHTLFELQTIRELTTLLYANV